jgi:hypothetical protein
MGIAARRAPRDRAKRPGMDASTPPEAFGKERESGPVEAADEVHVRGRPPGAGEGEGAFEASQLADEEGERAREEDQRAGEMQ